MEIEPDIDFQFPFINISKIPRSVKLNFFTKSDHRGFFFFDKYWSHVGWSYLPLADFAKLKQNTNAMALFSSNFLQRKMIIWLNYCTISFGKRQSRQRQSLLKSWRQPQNSALCLNQSYHTNKRALSVTSIKTQTLQVPMQKHFGKI